MATQHGVDMPICTAMADILAGEMSVDGAITELLAREHRSEV
jgi:glycerol-3-phosphate dehydrogenase (NAD(P)+)